MRPNKSFLKRLKISKNGKLTSRKAGQNHFNAKEGGRKQMGRNRTTPIVMTQKARARYLGI
jgi:ribosomal protein L35